MPNKPKQINRAYKPQREAFQRDASNYDFYNSASWRKTSKSFLQRNPLCKHCETNGFDVPAKVTDHIVPINRGGAMLDENNFQSLCEKCHNSKSGKEKSVEKRDMG